MKTKAIKKIMAIFLSLIMVLSLIPVSSVSADEIIKGTTEDGFEYSIENNEVTITGYKGKVAEIIIPDKIEIYPVVSIGDYAFYGRSFLTDIVIPKSVTSIGVQAFCKCSSITEINIPNNVTTISRDAFAVCSSLTKITIPDSVASIGSGAFLDCSSLTSIVIPDNVNSIRSSTFSGCTSLTSITIPENVSTIADSAFNKCDLSQIIVDKNNPVYDSRDNCNAIIETASNKLILGCANTTIPGGVTSIGSYAFYGRFSLKEIIIPEGVISIGNYAFSGCTSLIDIFIPNGVELIGIDAFNKCEKVENVHITDIAAWYNIDFESSHSNPLRYADNLCLNGEPIKDLVIPEEVTDIPNYIFSGYSSLTSIIIPDSVDSIGSSAFSDCTSLTSIIIPDGVNSIGSSAFSGCTSLTSIIIPDGVNSIGSSAFSGCTSLASIIIPDSVDSIEYGTFSDCTSLISIVIPNSVDSIEYGTFSDCTSLISIVIPNSVNSIEDEAFYGCSSLTSLFIPANVTSIKSESFSGCNLNEIIVDKNNPVYDSRDNCNAIIETASNKLILGCANTTIPDSVTSIGESAFYGCSSLKEISIPDSVTSIGERAFYGCSSLKEISIPDSVTSIEIYAFGDCGLLKEITIPGRVTSINDYAFDDCTSLTSIIIPSSVISISNRAFDPCNLNEIIVDKNNPVYDSRDNCNAIIETASNKLILGCANTTIPDSVNSIEDEAFYGCSSLTSLFIPANVTSIKSESFSGCNLNEIIVDKNNPIYDSRDNCNAIIETASNKLVLGCINTDIPDSVTYIDECAFSNCSSLTNIFIPDSITDLHVSAFNGCSSLVDIYYAGTKKQWEVIYLCVSKHDDGTFEDIIVHFNSIAQHLITDKETGITVNTNANAELNVKEIVDVEDYDNANVLLTDVTVVKIYDITFNKDGNEIQPDSIVTVKIPADNENSKVYRMETDGTLTDMNAVYENGFMVFTTEHFSIYILAEVKGIEPTSSIGITTPVEDTTNKSESEVCTAPSTSDDDKPSDTTEPSIGGDTKPTDPTEPSTGDDSKTSEPIADKGILGDVNGDGKVNVKDATMIQKAAAKLIELTDDEKLRADVNVDNKNNVKDATAIQKFVAKIETGLPIGKPVV